MRTILVFLATVTFSLLLAGAAPLDLGNSPPVKAPRAWPANIPAGRFLGDTIENPFVVPSIPIETTGTTAGFTNDYDEACPYSDSTAPDVVYLYVTEVGVSYITIDLCHSDYDTKVYVYDTSLDLIACNDDFYISAPCYVYSSAIENVPVTTGEIYYIVVDGYGTEFGDYDLEIRPDDGNEITCPLSPGPWAILENEPPLVDGYVDDFNSGCNHGSVYPPMTELDVTYLSEQYGILGRSGWYTTGGTHCRDTDWIAIVDYDHVGLLTLEFEAERPICVSEVWPQDCDAYAFPNWVTVDPCEPVTVHTTNYGLGYAWYTWIIVAPTTFTPPDNVSDHEFQYSIKVMDYEHVAAVPTPASADYTLGCPVLPPGETAWMTSDLSGFTNQFDPAMNQSDCPVTAGRDLVWEVYLDQGESFAARIRHDWLPLRDASLVDIPPYPVYVVDDARLGSESCTATSFHTTGWTGLSFYAPATGTYYLVWDGEGASGVGDHMHVYNDGDAVPPPPPAHDTCTGALELPYGEFSLADDLTNARNRFDPGREGCSGPGGTGRDVVYRAPMQIGQTLTATMTPTGGWDAEIYLVADCDDPLHSCVAGGGPDGSGGMTLTFTAFAPAIYWLVCDSYGNGERPFTLHGSFGTLTDAPPTLHSFAFESCHPNPFNPSVTLTFTTPAAPSCRVAIYGFDGRRVRLLANGPRDAGRHDVVWDGRDDTGATVPSGTYVARITAAGHVGVRKLTLLK